ncbi:predicted protein [Plenodomus lingam JN3]|uniref:Predicted protein n=1 Tax=Leptosphaeria maculans (strain JN3 / isolate v23.1.3 / race Av1-4-5-6-7-8) TaxID=985895 RepID=E5AD92_LEPMJ|nr:predicted protein [Plenodomus lingam JN3]CBY02444.1 predicted protein [Plenodomus lingam JN3]
MSTYHARVYTPPSPISLPSSKPPHPRRNKRFPSRAYAALRSTGQDLSCWPAETS